MVIRTFVFDYESDVDLFSFLLETSCQLFLGFSNCDLCWTCIYK